MNNNGRSHRPRKVIAELTVQWEVGAHGPSYILLPKGVSIASIVGMLEFAKDYAKAQAGLSAGNPIDIPGGTPLIVKP